MATSYAPLPRCAGDQMPAIVAPPVDDHLRPMSRSTLTGNSTTFTSSITIGSQPTRLVKFTICG